MQNFRGVVWTINALLTVRFEMLPFSGNIQNINMFGGPPEHFAIGYVHNDNLPRGNIALQYVLHYNMLFKTIAGRSDGVFWWFPTLSEDQDFFLSNSPKLSCGFKCSFQIDRILVWIHRSFHHTIPPSTKWPPPPPLFLYFFISNSCAAKSEFSH